MSRMPAFDRVLERARARAAGQLAEAGAAIHDARLEHNLALRDAAGAMGMSASEFSRVERGLVPRVPMSTLAQMGAVVGLEPRLRMFPAGRPLRDRAHVALLTAFRAQIAGNLGWATEVPLPIAADARAWDAVISGSGFRLGVEAETRLRDVQAVVRRVMLKKRDAGFERVLLVLRDSRWNREMVRAAGDALMGAFPLTAAAAQRRLAAGDDPGGDAVVLIAVRRAGA